MLELNQRPSESACDALPTELKCLSNSEPISKCQGYNLGGSNSPITVLHLPDTSRPFAIATDASKYASGGVLLQTNSNGEWHLCSYLSQSFAAAEWNYDIYDRELLAIIHALKIWHHYLQGSSSSVQVFTDHKNLTFFKQAQKLNRRQA